MSDSRLTKATAVLLAATLALAGCGKELTNGEIIAETQKCEAAGMKAVLYRDVLGENKPRRVECAPKDAP